MFKRLKKALYALSLIFVIAVAAEFGARAEDWLDYGENMLANPTFDSNMLVRESHGGHGKPSGQYKRWKLNSWGFRGPEIEKEPSPGTTRILVLGASETFGIDESENMEFPSQLGTLLSHDGNFEVVNGALPGMGVSGMVSYWEDWASQIYPEIVVIYPNALFYLCDPPPKRPRDNSTKSRSIAANTPFESRYLAQMKEILQLPGWLKKWRLDRKIAELRHGKLASWRFSTVPQDRLALFMSDLETLTDSIHHDGVKVILCTQAISADYTGDPASNSHLHAWLVNVPQADEKITLDFAKEANSRIVEFAQKHRLTVVDISSQLSGDQNAFTDLVHFRDHGAAMVAKLIAENVLRDAAESTQRRLAAKTISESNRQKQEN